MSDVPFTEKILDGKELSREDFSQNANPAIFDGIYTRAAYNAVKQTMNDRDVIISGNNGSGFNPYYSYANFIDASVNEKRFNGDTVAAVNTVLGVINEKYRYSLGVEPYVKNYTKYYGYNICQVTTTDIYDEANKATDEFFKDISGLTDREKVIKISEYLCDRLTYGDEKRPTAKFADVFTSSEPIKGLCGKYSTYFHYLCERANIPCVTMSGENHAWNAVYIEGKWLYVDVTNYDTARSMTWMLTETYRLQDEQPKTTAFIKELLIPNSTK